MSHFTNPFASNPSSTKPSSTFQTDNISNSTATEDAGNRYNVCMRSGFRQRPHTLVMDAYGALVRQESFDRRHEQEWVRPLAEELTGPLRPEPTDTFIASSVAPEDL